MIKIYKDLKVTNFEWDGEEADVTMEVKININGDEQIQEFSGYIFKESKEEIIDSLKDLDIYLDSNEFSKEDKKMIINAFMQWFINKKLTLQQLESKEIIIDVWDGGDWEQYSLANFKKCFEATSPIDYENIESVFIDSSSMTIEYKNGNERIYKFDNCCQIYVPVYFK